MPKELGLLQPELERISLDDNYLSGKVPREICGAAAVAALDATGSPVPASISDPWPTGLTDLVLRSNYLTGDLDLAACAAIINLDVRSNDLTGAVPGHPSWAQVHLMRVNDNHFDRVAHGLFTMRSLTYFDGAANLLQGRLPERIADLDQLTNLYLMDNDLRGPLPAGLFEARRLSFLFLDGNPSLGAFFVRSLVRFAVFNSQPSSAGMVVSASIRLSL